MTRSTITRTARRPKAKSSSNSIKTFRGAVNYLDSLVNWERVISPNYNSNNFGLARISRILAALGNPHKKFRAAHVAGTKGKGSTVTMLAEMVRASGIKTGVYTSPHLLDIRERIMVDGQMISEAALARAVAAVAGVMRKAKVTSPTYFEVLTAAAFKHFADSGVELAVVETGLGGRLDATNVVIPDVVGLTSISYDHMAQLGNSLEAIAREKAGIIKKGVPVVSAPQRDSVKQVFVEAAARNAAPLRFSDENVDFSYRFEFSRAAGRHARICLTTENSKFEHVQVPLLGEHQALNCTLALNMLDVLKTRGYPIDDQLAVQGLDNVHLPGRLQLINDNPRILIDGAHNAASIDALMRAIGQNITYDSMVVIFACHRDKDIPGMIKRLQLGADKMIFTSTGTPRSAEPAELAAQYMEISGKMTQVADTLDDAIQIALRAVSREDIICITGSFYLIAQAARKYSSANGAVELAAAT